MELMALAEALLRNPGSVVERLDLRSPERRRMALPLVALALVGFAAFGFVLGLTRDALTGLLSAPKLVLVGVGSLAISVPALHVYGRLLGSGSDALQSAGEALVALATTGLWLLGLCPVWLVFANLVDTPVTGYFKVMLGAIAFLALAAGRGLWVLISALRARGRTVLHLTAWTALYAMVGIQMAWVLRPFVGNPGAPRGEWLRPIESSAFDAAAQLLDTNVRTATGRWTPARSELPAELDEGSQFLRNAPLEEPRLVQPPSELERPGLEPAGAGGERPARAMQLLERGEVGRP